MELPTHQGSLPQKVDELSDKDFANVQALLALRGIELHRITGALGREAFSVHLHGQIRTLDTLPQVMAYARCLGAILAA